MKGYFSPSLVTTVAVLSAFPMIRKEWAHKCSLLWPY